MNCTHNRRFTPIAWHCLDCGEHLVQSPVSYENASDQTIAELKLEIAKLQDARIEDIGKALFVVLMALLIVAILGLKPWMHM